MPASSHTRRSPRLPSVPVALALRVVGAWLVTSGAIGCFEGDAVKRCTEGEVIDCACGAALGEQTCEADGTYGACSCGGDAGGPGDVSCSDGEERACQCLDGEDGVQRCQPSGVLGPCDCSEPVDDAGPPIDAGRCPDDSDRDGDGLLDCEEDGDGDGWTDRNIFNGVRVSLREGCGAGPFAAGCDSLLNPQAVDACLGSAALESTRQYAGWDFGSAATGPSCGAGYGFEPPFDTCQDPFQVLAEGVIQLQTGRHCFFVSEGRTEGCSAMYLSRDDVDAFTDWSSAEPVIVWSKPGGDTACAQLDAGQYPIRWFFNTWGADHSFRLRYCFGSADDCAPGRAIPSGVLRTSAP